MKTLVEEQFGSLYDVTGNILDLNTCLVQRAIVRNLLASQKQKQDMIPMFLFGVYSLANQLDEGNLTKEQLEKLNMLVDCFNELEHIPLDEINSENIQNILNAHEQFKTNLSCLND